MQTKHLIAGGCLVLLWLAENWSPFFHDLFASRGRRLRHDAKKFLFGGINSALSAVTLAYCFVHVDE